MPRALHTSIESSSHWAARGSLFSGTLFISPIASEPISRPVRLAASRYAFCTSGLRRCMSFFSEPMLTCTPSSPICLASSSEEGSALPRFHSHAPILNHRDAGAAKSGPMRPAQHASAAACAADHQRSPIQLAILCVHRSSRGFVDFGLKRPQARV